MTQLGSPSMQQMVRQYLLHYPGENERLQTLSGFLESFDGLDLIDRKNAVGHLTGSAFIVDRDGRDLLLIHHKTLDRWLQPGGHLEAGESPIDGALREANEEVGINPREMEMLSVGADALPVDIDSHRIPANGAKREGEHFHHDLRYLFRYTGNRELKYCPEELKDYRWTPMAELAGSGEFGLVVRKICRLLANGAVMCDGG
jgi:8-oxo-dGTP pyrophosphatase MutT (NUDIX family)